MNIIILVAGVGSRLYPLTKETPKCLLPIGKTTNIERILSTLDSYEKFDGKYIVGGFEYNKLCSVVSTVQSNCLSIKNNPFYKVTNSIASLWFCKDILEKDEDTIIINGDVCFDSDIYKLVRETKGNFVVVDSSIKCTDADYKVVCSSGLVTDMGKGDIGEYFGEYTGITKLDGDTSYLLSNKVKEMVLKGQYDTWYETALAELVKKGLKLTTLDIAGKIWVELDTLKDFRRANDLFGK